MNDLTKKPEGRASNPGRSRRGNQTKEPPTIWCSLPTGSEDPRLDLRMYDMEDDDFCVVSMGDISKQGEAPLVRVHSSCMASELFGALDCDCSDQLQEAAKSIAREGKGIIFYLKQEGRGHGLSRKIRAVSKMQLEGIDTSQAFESMGLEQDVRSYEKVVDALERLGISQVRLISNNPRKRKFLEDSGIEVIQINTRPKVRTQNEEYLRSKNDKLGHDIPLEPRRSTDGAISFRNPDGPWGFLSNFSEHPIFSAGRIWRTVEHFYQARKFDDDAMPEAIRLLDEPGKAKAKADANEWRQRDGWAEMREEVMLDGLRAKFRQHPDLREKLLDTGERQLVEHSHDDPYWGDGGDGTGSNRLGALLMRVREEIVRRCDSEPEFVPHLDVDFLSDPD